MALAFLASEVPALAVDAVVGVQDGGHAVHCSDGARSLFSFVSVFGTTASFDIAVDGGVDIAAMSQPPVH